jgi:dolichol kinase
LSIALNLLLVAGSISAMLALLASVKWLGSRHGLSRELQRKCVHVGTGFYALTLPLTFSERWPAFLLIVLSLAVLLALRLRRFASEGISSAVHGVARKSYGELFLALSVGFLFFGSQGQPVLYALPILVLTLSDAAAALTGTRYGRRHFQVEAGTKTWEGVTMFFLVTWILAMVLLLLMTDIDRSKVVLLSVMIAAFGALVEADSWRGFDNLFVPIGIHLLLANNLATEPLQLGLLAAAFIVTMVFILAFAPVLGLTNHAARAYAVLIFMITAVTAPHNAILPVAAVFAHILARHARPCRSPYPDLDLIAAVSGTAMFWLFLGDYTGQNALNAYNLGFAGAATGFLALLPRRFALAALIGVPLVTGILFLVASANPEHSQWHGTLWPWALASLGLCLAAGLSWPAWFDRYRAPRIMALSLAVPLILFTVKLATRTPLS